ncbi:MAG: ThiF family adenylyltransferase [Planctomycetaceae bacterium]|nr:ThiF family adenylyltransferase [Planctomycetaceae bacterium]
MKRTLIVGLGGIGGYLAEPLARYLDSSGLCRELVLADGDVYTASNNDRQSMRLEELGVNKAIAHAKRLSRSFPRISIRSCPEYVSERSIDGLVVEESVIFLCVDNHATRKLFSDHCRRLDDVLLISAGNDLTDGNVQVYWKVNGIQRTAPLDKHHDEIRFPTDRNPAELTCEELASLPGGGQIIFTNLTAASLALNAFYAAMTSKLSYGEVYFDVLTGRSNALVRR